jgi:hypothetical protein
MPESRSAETAALLRAEIRRLPLDDQTEMQRLRLTALEMALPLDALLMFLPESSTAVPVRRVQLRLRLLRCTGRLRICSRRVRRWSRRAHALPIPPRMRRA